MTEPVRFPGHHWASCKDPQCTGCHLCHGGLSVCTICGGMEGSLTTDCPGERMPFCQADDVYEGIIDYHRNQGWVHSPSPHSPAYYRLTE